MAITPRVAFSAEWGTMDEWTVPAPGSGQVNTYTASRKTGNYCFVLNTSTTAGRHAQYILPATRQLRFGAHNRPGANSVSGTSAQVYSVLTSDATELISVRIVDNTVQFIVANTTIVDTKAVTFGTWQQWGVDLRIHATTGWLRLWVDNVLTLSFDGNTGNSDIGLFRLGAFGTSRAFIITSGSEYLVDDLYIDDTTGVVAPALPPDRRFLLALPNADAVPNNWTPSTGTTRFNLVNNVPIVTSTFISSSVLAQEDVFTVTSPTLPIGYVTQAIWLQALADKSNGAVDTRVALRTQTTVGSDQALGTSLAMRVQRFAETNLTHKFGVRSAGTF
ncbi:MAG: hypothetical protein DDT21_01836 [Syntrophomonadaceae bacterium]|nr:hypothetical protein [Bacillota bacterium]